MYNCIGCEKHCRAVVGSRYEDCGIEIEKRYYIYPYSDMFLCCGLKHIMDRVLSHPEITQCKLSQNIVFVDFSYRNIKHFLGEDWIWMLLNSRIVFICDRKMIPLAHYWMERITLLGIRGCIIHHYDGIDETVDSVLALYKGQNSGFTACQKYVLTYQELRVLTLIYKGIGLSDISYLCNLRPKTVYAYKYSIEKKMGFSIKSFFHV